jgi:hypothetical protein
MGVLCIMADSKKITTFASIVIFSIAGKQVEPAG